MQSIVESTFALRVEETADGYVVRASGTLDSAVLPRLPPFLDHLHNAVIENRFRTVTFDCESLYFMNSSSVKQLVLWIVRLRSLPPHQLYHVNFRANARLAWQARTLGAICRAAPEMATVDMS
jgi:hypothetical protein